MDLFADRERRRAELLAGPAEQAELLARVDEEAEDLTPWEIAFVESCARALDLGRGLSHRQIAVLRRLERERIRE